MWSQINEVDDEILFPSSWFLMDSWCLNCQDHRLDSTESQKMPPLAISWGIWKGTTEFSAMDPFMRGVEENQAKHYKLGSQDWTFIIFWAIIFGQSLGINGIVGAGPISASLLYYFLRFFVHIFCFSVLWRYCVTAHFAMCLNVPLVCFSLINFTVSKNRLERPYWSNQRLERPLVICPFEQSE